MYHYVSLDGVAWYIFFALDYVDVGEVDMPDSCSGDNNVCRVGVEVYAIYFYFFLLYVFKLFSFRVICHIIFTLKIHGRGRR